jgi:hypothetical protein
VVFVSPPLATAFTTGAGNWGFSVFARQSSTSAQARVRYAVYVWTAANAKGADLVARANFATAPGTATPGTALAVTGTGIGGVNIAAGDKIVVDLEFQTINPTVTSATMSYFFGTGAQASVTLPASMTFTFTSSGSTAVGRHDVGTYTGKHKPNPAEESAAWIAANKHVECEDCHDPHATRAGLHTKGSNVAGAVLTGAAMVQPTYASPATNWQINTALTYAAGAVGATSLEAYVCFKCHSSYNTAIPSNPAPRRPRRGTSAAEVLNSRSSSARPTGRTTRSSARYRRRIRAARPTARAGSRRTSSATRRAAPRRRAASRPGLRARS